MGWFNAIGLGIVIMLLIPNAIFAAGNKNGFVNLWHNKTAETLETIGRVGCFICMVINVPYTYMGFANKWTYLAYMLTDGTITAAYCLIWMAMGKKNSVLRALLLSILPSVMFIVSGVLLRSALLTAFALIFAPTHVLISYKNASLEAKQKAEQNNE